MASKKEYYLIEVRGKPLVESNDPSEIYYIYTSLRGDAYFGPSIKIKRLTFAGFKIETSPRRLEKIASKSPPFYSSAPHS